MTGIKHRIKWIIIGSLAGTVSVAVLILLISWIVLMSGKVNEGLYAPLSVIALCIGSAAGGIISAIGCGSKILVTGIITGAVIFLLLTGISCAMGSIPQMASLFRIPVAVISAGVLPAFAVRPDKKRRKRSRRA